MLGIAIAMLLLPLFFVAQRGGGQRSAPYMAGANAGAGFINSLHQPQEARLHNYYLGAVLKPLKLDQAGLWLGAVLVLAALAVGVLS
jgi:hypothetical protein